MTWVKLDDAILDHPKVARLTPLGLAQHVAGVVWASRNLTDGIVPCRVVNRLLNWDGVALSLDIPADIGEDTITAGRVNGWHSVNSELIPGGLWHDPESAAACPSEKCHEAPGPKDDELLIHDFLAYQRPRKDVLAERAANREAKVRAGRKGAEARWGKQTDGTPDGTTNGSAVTNGWHSDSPVPVPVPVPKPVVLTDTLADTVGVQNGDDPTPPVDNAVENRGFAPPTTQQKEQPTQDQLYLRDRLLDTHESWGGVSNGAIVKLNRKHSRPVVTQALQRAREEDGAGARRPYALLDSICLAIAEEAK